MELLTIYEHVFDFYVCIIPHEMCVCKHKNLTWLNEFVERIYKGVTMKKRSLFIAFVVLLMLSACGNQEDEKTDSSKNAAVSDANQEHKSGIDIPSEHAIMEAIQAVDATESTVTEFTEFDYNGKTHYLADLYMKTTDSENDNIIGKIVIDDQGMMVQTALPIFAQEYIGAICESAGMLDPSIRYINEMVDTVEEGTCKLFDANGYRISVSLVEDGISVGDITESFRFILSGGDDVVIEGYEEGKTQTIELE